MHVDTFHLSKPYLSKYIKEKAGMTFQEVVREERMKKARMLLKETNQTVETLQPTLVTRMWSTLTACSKRHMT